MPEGPEVTIITDGLRKLLKNKYVVDLEINDKSRYYKKMPNGYNNFIQSINESNVKIKDIRNKGKFMYWIFSNGWIIFQTLGMSGGWFHVSKPHSGIVLKYKKFVRDDNINRLYFADQRHFATIIFCSPETSSKLLEKKLLSIGPDILNDKSFSKDDFIRIARKEINSKRKLSFFLVNQKQVSGIGNYLRSEILYGSRLNPHRLVGSLTDDELGILYENSVKVINSSYKYGGTSIMHYSDVDDVKGSYEFKMEIYGKKKDKFGNSIIREKIDNDKQSTYWVSNIQK